jgi:hypothetical protein
MSDILLSLQPMFDEALKSGKWFNSHYQDMWFSPKELSEYHAKGQLIWGPVNWTLRDPAELVREAEDRVISAQQNLERIKARIEGTATE